MNNPPDISQDPKEYEEYAHNVQKHVRGYLMVGALLLAFTAITVALSYVDFGARKANIGIAMLVATLKAGMVAAIFMHLAAEKRLIYRILVFTLFSRRYLRSGPGHGASGSISWKARRFILPARSRRLPLRLR
jgi:cytochrome c oxidase subunit 4